MDCSFELTDDTTIVMVEPRAKEYTKEKWASYDGQALLTFGMPQSIGNARQMLAGTLALEYVDENTKIQHASIMLDLYGYVHRLLALGCLRICQA
jgi:hypothetical protein